MLKLAKDANDVRGTCAAIAAETVLLPMEKRIEIINFWFDELDANLASDDQVTLAYLKAAVYGALAASDPIEPPKKQTDGEE